ncbi:type VII secretion-associated serine protease mycosin [Kitasatospora xanthocidica]|uniref:type VII secretion-associated serine protease mycosin n=1 Tax=Kitasatospora xanthocidica TaxID=83382 RepID=UPI0036F06254
MGRTNLRVRWRMAASALLAAGAVAGPVAVPAAADGSIRADQWHLDSMRASEMWKISKGENVTVAVIDDGFKFDHPDLVGQLLPGKDFSGSPGGVGSFGDGHGTAMASLIAGSGKADGGTGAYGLAPGAKVLPLKINSGTVGMGAAVSSDFLGQIGQAVTYAVEQGAKVINISQGIAAVTASPSDVEKLTKILGSAREKGVLVFASAGNSFQSGNLLEYPSGLPNVVAVGAVDQSGTVTSESQQGPQVSLAAPGIDIIEACTGDTGYCKGHGTSDASALASASAALVWSAHKEWTANQVLRVLVNTAGKPHDGSVRNDIIGYGIVRPRVALTEPGDPGPAGVSPIPAMTAPSTAPSAAPTASASAGASASGASVVPSPSGAPPVQPSAKGAAGSSSALPVVGGVVAGLVVLAGVVFVVVRRRKATAPQAEVQVPPPPSYRPPVPPEESPYAK